MQAQVKYERDVYKRQAEAPSPGSCPGETAPGLPVLRVPLLAGHRLCVLRPGAHAGPGGREVTAWPVN